MTLNSRMKGILLTCAVCMSCFLSSNSMAGLPQVLGKQADSIKPSLQENSATNSTKQHLPADASKTQEVHTGAFYTAELPVASDGEAERQQTFSNALSSILIQKSASPDIITHEEVKAALSSSAKYVKSFQYLSRKAASGDGSNLFLQVHFDPKSIDKLLQRAVKVVWVSSKPNLLVWFVKDAPGIGGRILNGENSDDGMVDVIKKKATDVGLTVMFPTLDLEEVEKVKAHDVCNFNTSVISQLSQRYGKTAIVIGCVKPQSQGRAYDSKWLLLYDGKENRFEFKSPKFEDVISSSFSKIAVDVTVRSTPVAARETAKVVLRIANVEGLEQYNYVVKCLLSLAPVKQANPVSINSTGIVLALGVIGGQSALLQALTAQDKLVVNADITVSPPGIDLDYKLVTPRHEIKTANAQSVS